VRLRPMAVSDSPDRGVHSSAPFALARETNAERGWQIPLAGVKPFWLDRRLTRSQRRAPVVIPAEPKPLGETLAFMQLLWAVAHGLESASKRMHAELGVTGPQRLVLRIVGHHGRISAGALAEVLHIHPSSLTGVLQRLEQAELIRRESDPLDRRRALLELTRRGMRLNDEQQGTIEANIAAALSKLPKGKIAAAKAALKAIASSLELPDEES
jgi:MarR family transcriptional regulator, organic hydroperoxide resistance regulator